MPGTVSDLAMPGRVQARTPLGVALFYLHSPAGNMLIGPIRRPFQGVT